MYRLVYRKEKKTFVQISFCFLVQLLGKYLVFPLLKETKVSLEGLYVSKKT